MLGDIQFTVWDESVVKTTTQKISKFAGDLEDENLSEEDRILLAHAIEMGMNDAFQENETLPTDDQE
jgi:hypothetical protein